ncbi:DNA polymerase III, delta subunit [Pseudobutyrivibrio sp. ACV-2]|uniref:DNA polymerase III subunit delta n=1 Tax=Pseudobutyrivibrio sp. ACV-2 TaxID=1520801 RepID=UPI00089588BC|nr:DNA polymerase III subunit delta [Pseudobutyrivibrio sp. ACV-2]SDZ87200.1 DNA polymerase III, delta subunit [Pseudobutyrivibrio sp. ACV-2]
MKRIDEDIAKGQFRNIYLLYGEEDYLKLQYKNKLLNALVAEGDDMNFSKYQDSGINELQVIDQAETMPFFAEHRVILIENSGFGKKMPEKLGEYLSTIPDFTIFIFVEPTADKRGKLYKAAKAAGGDIEINMPNESDLARWVGGILKESGVQMKKEAWSQFLIMTHDSMDNMARELEKLVSYVGDRKQITIDDVNAICVSRVETKIFDMINAIAAKDLRKTMDLYQDMLAAKEPPMRILYMIVRQFRQMKVIKQLADFGENSGTIARKVGAPDFAVKRTLQLARNYTDKEISRLLEDSADFETKVKTGQLDEKLAVELIIMKYAS